MENKKYNPTCILTGAKDNLIMHAHRNEKGEMVGWVFLHESMESVADDYLIRIIQEASIPMTNEDIQFDDTKSNEDYYDSPFNGVFEG